MEIELNCPVELHKLLFGGDMEIKTFLDKVLFGNVDNESGVDKLQDSLLSYHRIDGDFPEIVDLWIADAKIDLTSGTGKINLEYILGYSNTCAGTRTDLTKKDTADFSIDKLQNRLVLSLLDIEAPSTGDEF
ncbi:hypothetical protein [Pedobacter nyackensis]|uniref:hypothetical protein n=1 Tax=Pedobacter nyackensis TaxID=475255 RepID=UPI002930B1F9|nr:hypothetical protein [Pedobacter nyackensis]